MEMWAWLGAYLVGFALLQLYLYKYFIKDESTTEGTTADVRPSSTETVSGGVDIPEGGTDEDLVLCPNCGTYNRNDPMFSYCKECAATLE